MMKLISLLKNLFNKSSSQPFFAIVTTPRPRRHLRRVAGSVYVVFSLAKWGVEECPICGAMGLWDEHGCLCCGGKVVLMGRAEH